MLHEGVSTEKTEYLCEIGEYLTISIQASEKPRSISRRKTNAEPPGNQACAPRLEQSGAPGGSAADMEGCDEAAAERKRAERSFATAAGHEGAVVLRPCGLREG